MTQDGLVLVDKPGGWTSHDVVARVRRLAGTRKVGHAGTLDPMATGLLVLGVERATRLLTYVVGADKEYVATVRLGVSTTTDDAEGEVVSAADATGIEGDAVEGAVRRLTGAIQQVPSAVSAVKVDGRRAYARVRAGEQVELAPRPVTVHRFDVDAVHRAPAGGPGAVDVEVTVVCSSGTYVRALARDLGAALGVGGHLTALRRTRVGAYTVTQARTLEQLGESFVVLGLDEAARALFAVRELTEDEERALSYGQRIAARASATVEADAGEAVPGYPVTAGSGRPMAAFGPSGRLVALVEPDGPRLRPVLVFTPR